VEGGVVTIQSLEVRFEVDGDDRAAFARLFQEFIRRYEAQAEARKADEHRSKSDRCIGEPQPNGGA
jgi:hypothetical protein